MREVEFTHRFQRDYKRIRKGRYGRTLDQDLQIIVDLLAADQPLPPATPTMPCAANGRIIVTATSGRILS